jgi:hypothetical protein
MGRIELAKISLDAEARTYSVVALFQNTIWVETMRSNDIRQSSMRSCIVFREVEDNV